MFDLSDEDKAETAARTLWETVDDLEAMATRFNECGPIGNSYGALAAQVRVAALAADALVGQIRKAI